MTDVPFPMLSYPGEQPFVAGGRLVNCYPEPLPQSAGKPNAYWRVPGLGSFATAPSGTYRGGVLVAGTFYAVFGTSVYSFTAAGGAGVPLSGSVAGTGFCWCAANQNTPPDIAIVSPGVSAYSINTTTGAVISYGPPGGPPDPNIGVPNCVTFMSGMFVFTYGNGLSQVTNTNVTTINPANFANAQSKPDALYRPIALNNSNLLLVGANTMEVWGSPINPTGFPFSYIQTIYRGIPGPSAIAGDEDGWGKGLFFVGDDNRVSTLTTYTPTPISVLEVDRLIENEPDKTKIFVGVYNARGHGFVIVQGPSWCWEYDTTLQTWHERQSYLQTFWRGIQPKYLNFGTNSMWVCGDQLGPNLLQISGNVRSEGGQGDVQQVAITGSPTGGSFTLGFGGGVTSAIPYNATASQVQTALFALPTLNGNVACSGGPLPATPVVITFINNLKFGPQAAITAVSSLTGGTTPAVAMTHPVVGVVANPLRMRIETGPMGAFPRKVRINEIELYMTKGASVATGHPPDETNAMVEISISRDGGQVWSNPRQVAVGQQSLTGLRARSAIWGQAAFEGVRWRFDESAGLDFAFMGADMQSDVLR